MIINAAYGAFNNKRLCYNKREGNESGLPKKDTKAAPADAPIISDPKGRQENVNNLEANAENINNAFFYNLANRLLLDAEKPNSEPTREYFRSRGISEATLQRANIGYIDEWKVTEDQTPTRRIIFPRTDTAYTAFRLDLTKEDFKAINTGRQYETVGENSPYSPEGLEAWKKPVIWITETEFDALNLYEAGASAVVAIGHATTYENVINAAIKYFYTNTYILAFQYNNAGAVQTDAARKSFSDAKIAYISPPLVQLWAGEESPTALKDKTILRAIVSTYEERAKTAANEYEEQQRTGDTMIDNFVEAVQTRNYEPIPTGIQNIDEMLEGGFMRKTLVMLGAPPAMGKTALAQQIFESIAANGRNVLYINLEMSREQLIARSLARIAYNTDHAAGDLSPLEILRGYEWTDRQKAAVLNAADAYKQTIAPRIKYNPAPCLDENGEGGYLYNNNIVGILHAIEGEMQLARYANAEPPLVCIDYLQLVEAEERDPVEGMKRTIKALKDAAIEYNTVIFCIMANNRESNKAGKAEMESGRDTSALEYSADIMLTLNYTALEENLKYSVVNKKNEEQRKPYTPQAIRAAKAQGAALADDITLKVVKSRFSKGGQRCYFHFDGKHNVFWQMKVKYHDPMTEKKPLQLDINE